MIKRTLKSKWGGKCESCKLTVMSNELIVWYENGAIRHKTCDDYNPLPPKKSRKKKYRYDT